MYPYSAAAKILLFTVLVRFDLNVQNVRSCCLIDFHTHTDVSAYVPSDGDHIVFSYSSTAILDSIPGCTDGGYQYKGQSSCHHVYHVSVQHVVKIK